MACLRVAAVPAPRIGGDMTNLAALSKSGSHLSQPRAAVMSCAITTVTHEDGGAVILTQCS